MVLTEAGDTVIWNLRVANTHWEKFIGLMGDTSLTERDGLLIRRCRSIHCCFMRYPIDVLFLATDGQIVHVERDMRPWTFSPVVRRARDVLECAAGTATRYELEVGQRLCIDVRG